MTMTLEQKAAHKKAIEDKQAAARAAFPAREQEIFQYIRSRWAAMGDNYDPIKHEQPTLQEAAKQFGITYDDAKHIFIKIDGAGLDL